MSKINFNNTVTINQLINLIPELSATREEDNFHITPIILSEPGCGKTSILKGLKKALGDKYDYIYVDCPSKDFLDIAASIPDHGTKQLDQYIGSLFKMSSSKPKIIMLDEALKVPKLLKVLFTRLMLERCIGDKELPLGSMVFGTSNNASDGVGDFAQAHEGNRVCFYNMAKPTAKEWCIWATEAGVPSELRAFVSMTPRVMASYKDGGQDANAMIFNPVKPTQSVTFASPRSVAACSRAVRNYKVWGHETTLNTLVGTVGLATAEAMAVFLDMSNKTPSTDEIIANPDGIEIPSDVAALCMTMFNAVDDLKTQDDLSKFMKFVNRIKHSELQGIFFTMLTANSRTTRMANNNEEIKKWTSENYKFI
jgi:hypothetical protein